MAWDWLTVFAAATGLGLAGTWAVRRAAPHVGLMDAPDGVRKLQRRPVPVGGGLAVFAAAVAATVLAVLVVPEAAGEFAAGPRPWLALAAGAAILVTLGVIDDRLALRARHKLLGQVATAVVVVVGGGVRIDDVHALGMVVPLGPFAVPVTLFWLLAAVNALNLLDGMDGLLGTVGLIGLLTLAAIAALAGNPMAAAVALATAGGLAGFLRYNLPPATIYCGDCGSMLVGLVAGTVAVVGSMKSHAVALGIPAAVLVLPFLDTSAAIVRRHLSGRGLAVADRDHLHHVLLRRGLTVPRALSLLAALGLLAAAGALTAVWLQADAIALVTVAGVALILLTGGLFGMTEVRLVKAKASAVWRAVQRKPLDQPTPLPPPADPVPQAAAG